MSGPGRLRLARSAPTSPTIRTVYRNGAHLFLSALTFMELETGILKLRRKGKRERADELTALARAILDDFSERGLSCRRRRRPRGGAPGRGRTPDHPGRPRPPHRRNREGARPDCAHPQPAPLHADRRASPGSPRRSRDLQGHRPRPPHARSRSGDPPQGCRLNEGVRAPVPDLGSDHGNLRAGPAPARCRHADAPARDRARARRRAPGARSRSVPAAGLASLQEKVGQASAMPRRTRGALASAALGFGTSLLGLKTAGGSSLGGNMFSASAS